MDLNLTFKGERYFETFSKGYSKRPLKDFFFLTSNSAVCSRTPVTGDVWVRAGRREAACPQICAPEHRPLIKVGLDEGV